MLRSSSFFFSTYFTYQYRISIYKIEQKKGQKNRIRSIGKFVEVFTVLVGSVLSSLPNIEWYLI